MYNVIYAEILVQTFWMGENISSTYAIFEMFIFS